MKKIILILFCFLLTTNLYSQQKEAIWDQGVPICPDDKYITSLISKLGNHFYILDSISNNSNVKLFREIGFAFYDKGMYESADWYFKKAKSYKEKVELEKLNTKPIDAKLKNMEADLNFLKSLPKSYDKISKKEMLNLTKLIDEKIKDLIKERDSLLNTKNYNKELIINKNQSIESLNKEKDVINLKIESDNLKLETNGLKLETKTLKKYLWWLFLGISILILIIIALLQRKTIKFKDAEIDNQLRDINTKNTYLEHAARIIRHDMHSGINTYIPRGLSSLEKRLTDDDIEKLKISAPIKMIREGLLHTQKVYKRVYEFTNLVKQNIVLEKETIDLKELLRSYFDTTSYKDQVEIFDLLKLEVNPILFCNSIENIVKNGLQYNNSEKKLVKIYLEDNDIIIEDNGIGLSQEKLETITSKVIDKNNKSEKGLGLIIAKKILEEHGLTITCKNNNNNNDGTKIKITIKQKN